MHAQMLDQTRASVCVQVVYTHGDSLHVASNANVVDLSSQGRQLTDEFHFSFKHPEGKLVVPVIPQSYQDAMNYLNGLRAFNRIQQGSTASLTEAASKARA